MNQQIKEYNVLHLFCGIGGAAYGSQFVEDDYRGINGRFRVIGGIDNDPGACKNFERLTGAPAHCLDLFDRYDYEKFHGKKPSADWQEVTPADIFKTTGGVCPDGIFLSPPCKGFSGLLPAKSAASEKYQALNRLVVRGLWLALEAFQADLPGFILLENVPRIATRGKDLLHTVESMLHSYGYVTHRGNHDCGELGGLGQRRKRFLLIARQPSKIPAFIYNPPKQRVRSIGEVIGPLPLPDDPVCGPMHRLPRLQWKTWMRLALIPAGGDWRDLEKICPEQYRLEYVPWGGGPFGVQEWDRPAGTVIGNASVKGSNAVAVADPRVKDWDWKSKPGLMGVNKWDQPVPVITGGASVTSSNCAVAVADPRLGHQPREGVYRVQKWEDPSTTITGKATATTSNGSACISDPRLKPSENRHPGIYQVTKWDDPAPTVTGTRFGSGALAVGDERYKNTYRITPWDESAGTVTSGHSPANGGVCVVDPREGFNPGPGTHYSIYQLANWTDPAKVVTGATRPAGGALSVSDPRLGCEVRNGSYGVMDWNEPGKTVIGSGDVHAGTAAVADPRIPADSENGVWVIIAEDGTWHRPLTTFELAVLQGFPTTYSDGTPFTLVGKSDAKWREWIGNAVPPQASAAIHGEILRALLMSEKGETFALNGNGIWVRKDDGDEIAENTNYS
jgi:site-specific DNA-cytosine methylase